MNHPLVTIVIPTFNQGRYLPACIDHCLFQTYTNMEVIVVDGGSSDDTKEYLATLQKKIASQQMEPVSRLSENGKIIRRPVQIYPQNRMVKIVSFVKDIGATRTYNEGLKLASGKYCTYIVGDDIPHPHMIEEMAAALQEQEADFVYSDMNVVDDNGCIVRQMRLPDYSFEDCFARWYHLGASHLYKTEWHRKVGLMDETYQSANDYDHYLRFAMAGASFYHLPKILYAIRYHGEDRKTGQHTPERYQNLLAESKQCVQRARSWLQNRNNENIVL